MKLGLYLLFLYLSLPTFAANAVQDKDHQSSALVMGGCRIKTSPTIMKVVKGAPDFYDVGQLPRMRKIDNDRVLLGSVAYHCSHKKGDMIIVFTGLDDALRVEIFGEKKSDIQSLIAKKKFRKNITYHKEAYHPANSASVYKAIFFKLPLDNDFVSQFELVIAHIEKRARTNIDVIKHMRMIKSALTPDV